MQEHPDDTIFPTEISEPRITGLYDTEEQPDGHSKVTDGVDEEDGEGVPPIDTPVEMPFPIATGVESGNGSPVSASVARHSVLVISAHPAHTHDSFKSATVGTVFPIEVYEGDMIEQFGQERHTLPIHVSCPNEP